MTDLLQPKAAAAAMALLLGLLPGPAVSLLRAQEEAVGGVRIERLADESSWTAEAARLVLRGEAAADEMVAAMQQQAKLERWVVVRRLLRAFERMGADAFGCAKPIAALLDCGDRATVVLAFETLAVMAPPSFPSLARKFEEVAGPIQGVLDEDDKRLLRAGQFAVRNTERRSRLAAIPSRQILFRLIDSGQALASRTACDVLAGDGFDQAADRDQVLAAVGRRLRAMVPTTVRATRSSDVRPQDRLLLRMATLVLEHAPKSKDANVARGYLMLCDTFPELRSHWARELTVQGPDSVDALPAIAAYLEFHRDDAERNRCAVGCVLAIGGAAKSVLPHLEKLRRTDDAELRPLVQKAIDRLRAADK